MPQPWGPDESLQIRIPGSRRQTAQHVVQHREPQEEAQVLKGTGDAETGDPVRGKSGQLLPVEDHGSSVRMEDPRETIDEGRLPCPVGTDECRDPSPLRSESDPVEGWKAAEMLREVCRLEECLVGAGRGHGRCSLAGC